MKKLAPFLALLLLVACTKASEPLPGSEKDYPRITVEGFLVEAKIVNVQKEDVFIFDYLTEEETYTDLQMISGDARRIGTVELPWSKQKAIHVFATGRQIAVYVGNTVAVLNELLKEGGEQIVGDPLPKGITFPVSSATSSQVSSI
jgi:hypothetical protein